MQGNFRDCAANSNAITLDKLAKKCVEIVFKFVPEISRENGRMLLVANDIKISKSGSKMPCVKKLHQESDSNTKLDFKFTGIFGII